MLRSNANAEEELRRPTLDTIMSSPRKHEDRGDRPRAIPQRGVDQSSVGTADATPSRFTERSLQPEVDGSSDPESEEEGMLPSLSLHSAF